MAFNNLMNFGPQFLSETIVQAKGVYLCTSEGRTLLDWTGSQMSCLLGHGHPELICTIHEHAQHLDHLLSCMVSPPVLELAQKLREITPEGLDKAMFLNTGSESVEAAIRLAKLFTGRYEVVALSSSWHGMTGESLAAQYHEGRAGYGPTIPGNLLLPAPNAFRSRFRTPNGDYDWESELSYGWELVDQSSCGSMCAVIVEPILSSGGMHVLPAGYMRALQDHCRQRNMLLIVDEAQTSLGRCGAMFMFERDEIVPDILVLSKNLGSGFPLSAVMTSDRIAEDCERKGFLFCTTHVNDPFTAAIGCTVIDVVLRDNLVSRAAELGSRLFERLSQLKARYECVGDVRGCGLMAGIEIVESKASKRPAPTLAKSLASRMLALGLSSNLTAFNRLFRIAPPLTITDAELEAGLELMEQAFADVLGPSKP